MLKSDICHLHGLSDEELIEQGEDPQDLGGYFIVNGSERAVVTMEEIAPNKIILERIGEVEDRRAKAIVTLLKVVSEQEFLLNIKNHVKVVYFKNFFPLCSRGNSTCYFIKSSWFSYRSRNYYCNFQ